jgi:hypothetical protein
MSPRSDVGRVEVAMDSDSSGINDVQSGGDEVDGWLASGDCDGTRPEGSNVEVARSETGVGDCAVDGMKVGSRGHGAQR